MRMVHRALVIVFFASFILAGLAPATLADDFTAVVNGDWKDPLTWGRTGFARDGGIPGIMAGRWDSITIPLGITVYFEGEYYSLGAKEAKSGGSLTTIEVFGHVKGKKGNSKIKLRATEDILVEPTGEVGGSKKGTPKNHISVKADSNVTVQGKVYSPFGPVDIEAGKDINIGGNSPGIRVKSGSRYVNVKSKKGNVNIAAGDTVTAGTSVRLQAGKNKDVNVNGVVKAGKNIHINRAYYSGQCGNVVIGPQGALLAPDGEIRIKADTLRVQGRIEGHTVQKICKVVIVEGGGFIEQTAKKSKQVTNKALLKWEAKERERQEAAERAEKAKVNVDDFSFIDMGGANGTVLGADLSVQVAGGLGSTLDLTGNPPGIPVIDCPGPIDIFVETVLLDPGVMIEDLCGPGPVMVNPPVPTFDPVCLAYDDTVAYPGYPSELRFQVANMGFDSEVYEFALDDSLGWGVPPTLPPIPLGGAFDPEETVLTIPFDPPAFAIPGVDTNRVTLTVRSTTDPAREYSETYILAATDIAELKSVNAAVWGVNPAPGGAIMGIEHWLANNGQLDDDYAVTVSNLEGWPVLPYPPDVFIPFEEDYLFLTEFEIPAGTPDGFPNEVYITVESLSSPGVASTDTIPIQVNVVSTVPVVLPTNGTIRHRAHPNPFNPKVTISFAVPAAGNHATVTVYDINGRRVRQVFDGPVADTGGTCSWDGTDSAGRPMSSGVYFYRITAGGQEATGKMILAK